MSTPRRAVPRRPSTSKQMDKPEAMEPRLAESCQLAVGSWKARPMYIYT